jgi:hypothetical protein
MENGKLDRMNNVNVIKYDMSSYVCKVEKWILILKQILTTMVKGERTRLLSVIGP